MNSIEINLISYSDIFPVSEEQSNTPLWYNFIHVIKNIVLNF
jgi:hypothetical protein